ncbi:Putative GTP-binding protein [Komagataella phaffii CBS 7435]|uniref:GTPase n=2 Tax=Komagataella phaffii TaxID=460519 RepID=C4R1E1_KOMPG|nr:GTPase [Komagataella phaffii GS115]AOA62446.1 GQ67_00733T0 [Komagataella phaffii]KAI0462003.1 hypothetical protein LJB42_004608 [Komagataella kurtzmanii]CAH2448156.1 Putative GTP-binding protein [Komagataella phaffii CBS 7435]AOA67053.1 GQ68_00656T0 [Komagataella phaffii GS115]CAY69315.1 GTPase [Komagataella phaffii GS115]
MASRPIKVLLIGDQGVGKSSIRRQLYYKVFSESYKATIGADYLTSKIHVNEYDEEVILQIWDTAGQERFNSISQIYYRGTDICIIVYDICNSDSFYNLNIWVQQFLNNCQVSRPTIMIVGNKLDKSVLRQISLRQAREFSEEIQADLVEDVSQDVIEVSARDFTQIENLFQRAALLALQRQNSENVPSLTFDSVDFSTNERTNGSQSLHSPCSC